MLIEAVVFLDDFLLPVIQPRAHCAGYHCLPDEAVDAQCCAIKLGATYLAW